MGGLASMKSTTTTACALLLLVAEDSSASFPPYGIPLPGSWLAPWANSNYYDIEIDISASTDAAWKAAWPNRKCPCWKDPNVLSVYQCPMGGDKYQELFELAKGTTMNMQETA